MESDRCGSAIRRDNRFSVLVADDDEQVRDMVRRVLEHGGHRVRTATDGEDAWRQFQGEPADLVITDIKMPKLDGIRLLEKIRSREPTTEVILITGFADTDLVVQALRRGASNFVEKPFTPVELLRQLEPAVTRRGLALQAWQLQEELEAYRRREEMDQRLATLGRLLAGLAHELYNPLTVLKGNAELVQMLVADLLDRNSEGTAPSLAARREEIEGLLEDMGIGARRIQELVGAMKRLGPSSPTGAERQSLAEALEGSLRLAAVRRRPSVELEMPLPSRELFVPGSVADLESCFVNLLVNAFEALGDISGGRVRVTVEVHDFATPAFDGFVEVTVEDNGPGISPEALERAFEPFFTTKEQGTGLGLHLAYQSARRCGAQLELHSDPGGGTRATVRLPLYLEGSQQTNADDAPHRPAAAGAGAL